MESIVSRSQNADLLLYPFLYRVREDILSALALRNPKVGLEMDPLCVVFGCPRASPVRLGSRALRCV